jgi:hypothetical protein
MRNPGDHQLLASQIHLEYLMPVDSKEPNLAGWNRTQLGPDLQKLRKLLFSQLGSNPFALIYANP